MRTIEAATQIAADPRQVWEVLTDFARYPEWSTFIWEIDGRAEAGAQVRVVIGPPDRKPHVVRTPLLEATPEVRLAWAAVIPGATWLPAVVFSGVHEFVLTALPGGGTSLLHREHFSGLLARLTKEGPRGADEGFEAFNVALKRRAEEAQGEGTGGERSA